MRLEQSANARRALRPVVAIAVALLTASCASSGSAPAEPVEAAYRPPAKNDRKPTAQRFLKDARIKGVVVGETTREDLLREFGYPTHRTAGPNGEEIWTYLAALQPAYPRGGARTTAQRVAAQRKLFITFESESAVVNRIQSFESGMPDADALKDTGPEFPELQPIVLAPVDPEDLGREDPRQGSQRPE